MVCIIGVTFHRNHHSLILTFSNIFLLIKHLVEDVVFEQCLRRGIKTETLFCNTFGEGTTSISIKVALENYLNCAKKNWQNINVQVSNTGKNSINDTVEKKGCNTKLDTKNENKYYQAINFCFQAIAIAIAGMHVMIANNKKFFLE